VDSLTHGSDQHSVFLHQGTAKKGRSKVFPGPGLNWTLTDKEVFTDEQNANRKDLF